MLLLASHLDLENLFLIEFGVVFFSLPKDETEPTTVEDIEKKVEKLEKVMLSLI